MANAALSPPASSTSWSRTPYSGRHSSLTTAWPHTFSSLLCPLQTLLSPFTRFSSSRALERQTLILEKCRQEWHRRPASARRPAKISALGNRLFRDLQSHWELDLAQSLELPPLSETAPPPTSSEDNHLPSTDCAKCGTFAALSTNGLQPSGRRICKRTVLSLMGLGAVGEAGKAIAGPLIFDPR